MKEGLAKALYAIGMSATILVYIAVVLFLVVMTFYVSLAGWTAIVASGTLLFAAPVTWGGVAAFVVAIIILTLFGLFTGSDS